MSTELNLANIDKEAFAREVDLLRAELIADLGPADLAHLHKMILWERLCSAVGYLTAWLLPNPVSALLISQGILFRWMVMHHVSHRGYDRVPGIPDRLTSRCFAKGKRRYLDWFDWMHPDAWNYEHNNLHHMRTGQEADPDLVERNVKALRSINVSLWVKYLIIFVRACIWKWNYYVPATVRVWHRSKDRRAGHIDLTSDEESLRQYFDPEDPRGVAQRRDLRSLATPEGRKVWFECILPYAFLRFGAIPALFGVVAGLLMSINVVSNSQVAELLGKLHVFGFSFLNQPVAWVWTSVLLNSVLAEIFTNLHSFVIIVTNHAGDDVPRFADRSHGKAEWYLRQVAGSVNFNGGTDLPDFLQGYLNYQIEHHLWPDLPMLKYRQAQPKLKRICEKYGIPYIQESVWKRLMKLLDIMMGKTSMPISITSRTSSAEAEKSFEMAR